MVGKAITSAPQQWRRGQKTTHSFSYDSINTEENIWFSQNQRTIQRSNEERLNSHEHQDRESGRKEFTSGHVSWLCHVVTLNSGNSPPISQLHNVSTDRRPLSGEPGSVWAVGTGRTRAACSNCSWQKRIWQLNGAPNFCKTLPVRLEITANAHDDLVFLLIPKLLRNSKLPSMSHSLCRSWQIHSQSNLHTSCCL